MRGAPPAPGKKAVLRREYRKRRHGIAPLRRQRAARAAASHLLRRLGAARRIGVYLPVGSELDTRALIAALHRRGWQVHAPRVTGPRRMRFCVLHPGGAKRRNRFGIPEPVHTPAPGRLDVLVVPLVAFDRAGGRIGTGGGYYDAYLGARRGRRPLAVGLAHSVQECAAVPAARHDARLDAVVTERGWRWTGAPRR